MRDLYAEAAQTGYVQAAKLGQVLGPDGQPMTEQERVLYWTARHAARQASDALLEEAKRVGVTEEQWEALRVVAADVAYD